MDRHQTCAAARIGAGVARTLVTCWGRGNGMAKARDATRTRDGGPTDAGKTLRKQAEEVLLKAGALQKAIFNSANFSSIATDAKGVIQIFNVGAERMLGYTAAEVINR